jgi:hypothetical protein
LPDIVRLEDQARRRGVGECGNAGSRHCREIEARNVRAWKRLWEESSDGIAERELPAGARLLRIQRIHGAVVGGRLWRYREVGRGFGNEVLGKWFESKMSDGKMVKGQGKCWVSRLAGCGDLTECGVLTKKTIIRRWVLIMS